MFAFRARIALRVVDLLCTCVLGGVFGAVGIAGAMGGLPHLPQGIAQVTMGFIFLVAGCCCCMLCTFAWQRLRDSVKDYQREAQYLAIKHARELPNRRNSQWFPQG